MDQGTRRITRRQRHSTLGIRGGGAENGCPERFGDRDQLISCVLGRANMSVAQLLQLGAGSVLELDRKVGEAIDIYVNNRLVARGEVVIVDERLGVTMTEIIKDGDTAA